MTHTSTFCIHLKKRHECKVCTPNAGERLYYFYRFNPPTFSGATHRAAYFDGYNGSRRKYVKDSWAWWAYKAGQDNAAKVKVEVR